MRRCWTADELAAVQRSYAGERTDRIASRLGRTVQSVYQAAAKMGLRKSAEFLASAESGILRKGETRRAGIATQFRKGNVPANKGLRRPGWSPGRMAETQFRKGERTGVAARNWRPVGTILTDTEGYRRIKVREALPGEAYGFGNASVWPLLQRQVWERERGPIPAGHVIVFRDGVRANCGIENLECVPRAELARRNSPWTRYPRALAEAIQLNGALRRKLRKEGVAA